MIIVTQIPFLATVVISFMNWNAYYPNNRGFAGIDNFKTVLTDVDAREAIIVTILLGIAGSFVAGFFLQMVNRKAGEPFHPAGLIASIIGGMVLIFVARLLHIA